MPGPPAHEVDMATARATLIAGAIAGAAAVALGAFGAHALHASLDAQALSTWHTAVEYQFWHALALLAVGALARGRAVRSLGVAAIAFAAGIVLFSGSLYLLALGAPHVVGIVTPVGGVAFIVGWLALVVSVLRER
jgi:uncharacterized membrane protein YgdD (TMEM256/DUF423 family)